MALTEQVDYYFNNEGMMVLTSKYLAERGYCCGNGCTHCPYDYECVPEPKKSELTGDRTLLKAKPTQPKL